MRTMLLDLRYALRIIRTSPGFAFTAIAGLALGVGANIAIFALVNTVILRPLPYPEPNRLVWVWGRLRGAQMPSVSPPDFRDYRRGARSFEHFGAMGALPMPVTLTGIGEPAQIQGTIVTADFFETLGVRPAVGRWISADEENSVRPRAAVLSYGLWQRRFSGNTEIAGRSITIDGTAIFIAGVAPPSFQFPSGVDIWLSAPVAAQDFQSRGAHFLSPIGRLKPGASIQQAQAEMDVVARRLAGDYPATDKDWGVMLVPLRDRVVGSASRAVLIMLGAVGFVLLIACANVANLLLARSVAREKEVAIRLSLGATRWRLVRQLLTESLLLSGIAAVLGLLAAGWLVGLGRTFDPGTLPRLSELAIDANVVLFTCGAALLTALLFGLAPALALTARPLAGTLHGTRISGNSSASRFRSAMVVSEVALSLTLLIAAGLMLRSFVRLSHVDPGFRADGIVTARMNVPFFKYSDAERRAEFFAQLLPRLSAIPGVRSAAIASQLPLSGQENDTYFTIEGHPLLPNETLDADNREVSSQYFAAMGIPLLRGRALTDADNMRSPRVAVINHALAQTFFKGEDPVGKRIFIHLPQPVPTTIVGVVGDIRHSRLQFSAPPEMYMPLLQVPYPSVNIVLRTGLETAAAGRALQQAIWSIDSQQPVGEATRMTEIVALSVGSERLQTFLLGAFSGLALVLAMLGIYGVISYSVSQRVREIGIRVALGARTSDVLTLITGQGMRLAFIGAAIGVLASLGLTQLIRTMLFEVTPTDAVTFTAVSAILLLVALAACYVPARRAARVDPMQALRME